MSGHALDQSSRRVLLLVDGEADAEAELRVVLEERVGPRRAVSFAIHRVGRRRQVAAVDGRTAGGVGDHGAIAEELSQQPQVGRLAASGTRPRELEERLQQLRPFHEAARQRRVPHLGQPEEEVPVGTLAIERRRLRRHLERPVVLRLVVRRADLDAERATRAVLRGDLQGVTAILEPLPLRLGRLEAEGGLVEVRRVVDLGAECGVRAHQHALAALDAELLIPERDLRCEVPLFPLRRAGRERAIHREGTHGEPVALLRP